MGFLLASLLLWIGSVNAVELNGLDTRIQSFLQTYQPAPDTGVAVGVVHKGQLVFFRGYGFRDRAARLPVTENTLFRIGSNTKSFLSTTIAILSDEGKLNVEQPVRDFLPAFALESENIARQATLKDLLSHRVGLPRHDALWYFTPFSREQLFSKLAFLEMNKAAGYGFGEKWQYNNMMYMALGMVAEKVGRRPWDELMRDKILIPLGMSETGFSVIEMNKSSDFANAYSGDTLLPSINYDSIGPAGIEVSNVADLTKWVALFLNHGRLPSGQQLVSQDAQNRMFRVESEGDIASVGVHISYGLGWFLQDVAGHKLVWHGGNIDGFSTHVSFMPDEDTGLIILVNQTNGTNLEVPFVIKQNGTETKLLPVIIYEHLMGAAEPASDQSPLRVNLNELLGVRQGLRPPALASFGMTAVTDSLGRFEERAYGELELYKDAMQVVHMRYYNLTGELKATPELDKYVLEVDGAPTLVEFSRNGNEISDVRVQMEPAVSSIRFVRK